MINPTFTEKPHYQQLITLFDACFSQLFATCLVKGEDEPVYLPANKQSPWHQVIFAHSYFASALHEIAHWCIAGAERRQQVDYGYWYCPDGRDAATQQQFEKVEVKPQALEWLFSVAAGVVFNVSCDNLNGTDSPDRLAFQRKVWNQVMNYLEQGIPARPARFIAALHEYYQTPVLTASQFLWPEALS